VAAAIAGQPLPEKPISPAIRSSLTTVSAEARPTAQEETRLFEQQVSPKPPLPKKSGGKWILAVAALLIVAAAAWLISRTPDKIQQVETPAETKPERAFSYWIMVQKYRSGEPYQAAFRLAGEINFENDYHVRLHVSSARGGYLYVINEAPEPVNGLPEYVTLFPSPTANDGQSKLAANQQIAIPERGDGFVFDKDQGTEKLWLIWSVKRLPELESLKSLANPKDRGLLTNPEQIESVRNLIAKHRTENLPVVGKDESNRLTNISGKGDVIAHLINLEHH